MNTYTKDQLAPKNLGTAVITTPYLSADAVVKAVNEKLDRIGADCFADDTAIAMGSQTSAVGGYSVTEGDSTATSGDYSHAEGRLTLAYGQASHTEGCETSAYAEYLHADGIRAVTKPADRFSYIWSGVSSDIPISSNGAGTYTICPNGGLSGIYIGTDNLQGLINERISSAIGAAIERGY